VTNLSDWVKAALILRKEVRMFSFGLDNLFPFSPKTVLLFSELNTKNARAIFPSNKKNKKQKQLALFPRKKPPHNQLGIITLTITNTTILFAINDYYYLLLLLLLLFSFVEGSSIFKHN
jgi:hypothetical protein